MRPTKEQIDADMAELEAEFTSQATYVLACQDCIRSFGATADRLWDMEEAGVGPSPDEIEQLKTDCIINPLNKHGIALPPELYDRMFSKFIELGFFGVTSCDVWDLAHGLQHAVERSLGRGETHH